MSDFSVVMNWQEDQPGRNGPGISRPMPGAPTAMYDLRVKPLHGTAMKVTLRAVTQAGAEVCRGTVA